MKINVLGTNGWYADEESDTVCLVIGGEKEYVVLDAGGGFSKLDKYVDSAKPINVLLSHFHYDHIIGFHVMPKFRFEQPVTIFGQLGTKKVLNVLVNHPFTFPLDELPYEVTVRELPEGVSHPTELAGEVKALPLVHADPCFGYRLNIDGKVVTYCTDTGYCDNILKLAREADVLITECALAPGVDPSEGWSHLNPELAAKAAKEAGAKRLLLTHFSPTYYAGWEDRKKAEAAAQKIFPATTALRAGIELIGEEGRE